MAAREEQVSNGQGTLGGILARLWWMLFGNVVLALSLIFIFRKEGGFFHPADWVFWITVATLVLVRYVDVRFCDGQTATGRPASTADWSRYAGLLVAGAILLWAIAHATNYVFVSRMAQG